MIEKTELKPCPFCGGNKIKLYSKTDETMHGFIHLCEGFDDCMVKVESRLFANETMAIEAWNRRDTESIGKAYLAELLENGLI